MDDRFRRDRDRHAALARSAKEYVASGSLASQIAYRKTV
jgi:hypothetical protein